MDEKRHLARQDRPITSPTADQLDLGPFVESLVRALIVSEVDGTGRTTNRRATGFTVGLTGRWGLGKSSVLHLLEARLGSMDRVIVAVFNPWLFRGRDELVSGFFNAMRTALGRSRTEEARDLLDALDRYRGAVQVAGHGIAAVVDLHGGGGLATTAWSRIRTLGRGMPKPKPRSPDDERRALEEKIARSGCAVVVLIDELDRIEDDDVRAVAQLVKAVGDIRGVSYLVAYDPDRVVDALGRGRGGDRRTSGERYLEKIIQHPIPLRPLFGEDTKALLEAALIDHGVELAAPRTESQQALFDHLVSLIETPREVKRLIGAYAVLERTVRGEICPYDVLGYCWILTKSPAVRDKVAAHIDELVNDPGDTSLIARTMRHMNKQAEPDLVGVLGEAAAGHKAILELLFPRFDKLSSATDSDGDRLSRRRNLVRLLYLGNPPGAVPRATLDRLWGSTDLVSLQLELRELMNAGKLAVALDRIDDLLPLLPDTGDTTFWVALARLFYRGSDWLSGAEPERALADDTATILYRLALRDVRQKPRVQAAIAALIADGDLVIVPWILRKLLFAHGLTSHAGPRGGEILSLAETRALLASELPRYREAVASGVALRRLPNVEAIFVLMNTADWGEDLRAAITGQLDTVAAIATFAGLLVPPSFVVDLATLDTLCQADVVLARVDTLIANDELPTEQWLADGIHRLRRFLTGEGR